MEIIDFIFRADARAAPTALPARTRGVMKKLGLSPGGEVPPVRSSESLRAIRSGRCSSSG